MKLNTYSRIFATKGNFTLSYNRATLLLISALFAIIVAVWGGYTYANWKVTAFPNSNISQLVYYSEEGNRSNIITEQHIQVLTEHMGRVEANLMRINALGERIVALARLDPEEFNFQHEVATGGPLMTEPNGALLGKMKIVDELLSKRYTQLNTLLFALQMKADQKELSLYGLGKPVQNGWISSFFGPRVDPITGHKAWHAGVDIVGKEGSEVKALASGVVSYANKSGGYGQLVEIRHADGLSTRYGHNKAILVKPGQLVKKGQAIALLGSSGRSTGPHVHLEVHRHGQAVDPGNYFSDLKK